MMLIEESAVAEAALPVARFKDHLRLGTGFADDGLQDEVLAGFLRAALAAVEARTGKILLERGFTLALRAWREPGRQVLPVAPVGAVLRVAQVAADGVETEVAPALWRLEADMQRPALVAVAGGLPPVPQGGAVHVGFRAGFAPGWDGLPPDLGQAVLMLAAHYYEYRHETALGAGCMPFGVTALIERYRAIRLSAGGGA